MYGICRGRRSRGAASMSRAAIGLPVGCIKPHDPKRHAAASRVTLAGMTSPGATMQPIPTGLIGYGTAGAFFHAPLIAAASGLRLAAIGSRRSEDILRDFPEAKAYENPQDLIADPSIELVVIA